MNAVPRLEYQILELLDRDGGPMGAGALQHSLRSSYVQVSEPTLGRVLREMDSLGLTTKISNLGRVLSPAGKLRLDQLRTERERAGFEREFLHAMRALSLDDVADVLVARRAVEREAVRLAALHATEEEIGYMARAIDAQRALVAKGESGWSEDHRFHNLLAQASRNRVLLAALKLIRSDEQLQHMLETVRQRVGGPFVVHHQEILDAIRQHNPFEAERCMLEHIDRMIRDVECYRQGQMELKEVGKL